LETLLGGGDTEWVTRDKARTRNLGNRGPNGGAR